MIKKPYFIAEISGNHEGSLKKVLRLMSEIKKIKADAVKFQTFKAERMSPNINRKDVIVDNQNSPWHKKNLYSIYKKTEVPENWYKKIFEYGKKINLEVFSSPFSVEDVDFLEKFNVKFYKIASLENTNYELLKKIANTGKKIIISTGTASKKELIKSINILKKNGAKKIIILKCITGYPSKPKDYNLKTLIDMKKIFNCQVGVSDHTLSDIVPITSLHYGGEFIEKHICLKRKKKGIDSFYSQEVQEFKSLIKNCNESLEAIGKPNYGNTKAEKLSKKRRRILYTIKNVKKNDLVDNKNIIGLRGGEGISINLKKSIEGKKFLKNLKKYTKLNTKHFN